MEAAPAASRGTGAEFDTRLREIARRDDLLKTEVLEVALEAYEAMFAEGSRAVSRAAQGC